MHLSGLDARRIEQVGDQSGHAADVDLGVQQQLALLVRRYLVGVFIEDQREEVFGVAERAAQVVAHRGQQFGGRVRAEVRLSGLAAATADLGDEVAVEERDHEQERHPQERRRRQLHGSTRLMRQRVAVDDADERGAADDGAERLTHRRNEDDQEVEQEQIAGDVRRPDEPAGHPDRIEEHHPEVEEAARRPTRPACGR